MTLPLNSPAGLHQENFMSTSEQSAPAAEADDPPTTVWWRLPIVWMVIAGPAAVVVASFATLGLAITHPDPVLTVPVAKSSADLPAVQGRNHAATPSR